MFSVRCLFIIPNASAVITESTESPEFRFLGGIILTTNPVEMPTAHCDITRGSFLELSLKEMQVKPLS